MTDRPEPRRSLRSGREGGPRDRATSRSRDAFAHLELDQTELREIARVVRATVRSSFRGALSEQDIEDVIAAVWEGMLREELKTPVRDRRAFAAKVGWRAANELKKRAHSVPADPQSSEAFEREDPSPSGLERVDARARHVRLVEALHQLDADKRAAFELRFVHGLAHDEACARLGIKHTAYFDRIKKAKANLEAAAGLRSAVFARRERALLSDYVAGIATERERDRAERLIDGDPRAAAIARELRRSHEDAAALAPPTLALAEAGPEEATGPIAALADRARETLAGLFRRSPEAAELASSPAVPSAGRGAGAASAGILAKTIGGLGAGKLAIGCLGTGAIATIACVATGVIPLPGGSDQRPEKRKPEAERSAGPPERVPRQAQAPAAIAAQPLAPSETKPPARPPEPEPAAQANETDAQPAPAPEPEPTSTLEPDVAPEVQEFGVEGAGTPVGGAPPDTNDSDGASASAVRQEFGP